MKFSLILATLGRTDELTRFLSSLDRQTFRDFELVVVDQNSDDRLVSLLAPYLSHITIRHLRSEPGLSRARNVALAQVDGEIVAFPDDDCWYPDDLLESVVRFFDAHPEYEGLTGKCANDRGEPRGWWDSEPGRVTKINLFRRSGSVSMFFRRSAIARVGTFDETLGLGADTPWQGCEDLDYVARAITAGVGLYYRPDLEVYHDDPPSLDSSLIMRAYRGARATGRLLRIHQYPFWYVAYWSAGALGLSIFAVAKLDFKRARYHWLSFLGRLEGWSAPIVSNPPA